MKDGQLTLDRIFGDPDINGVAPISLKFSPDGEYISFLKGSESDFEQLNLWVYRISDGTESLLVEASSLAEDHRILSDEEKARRERRRITQRGIIEYYWSPIGDSLIFPLDGNLFHYKIDNSSPIVQLTDSDTFETDIRFSPDGKFLSFVREKDLYVIDLASAQTVQLTTDGGGTISNGLAEFIAQEEMHRYEGYWWSPDSKYIAFTQVDESSVELSQRYEIDADSFGVYDQRYPFTGTPNAYVKLGVVDINSKRITWSALEREKDSYIARINWLRDSEQLALQIQSRDQKELDLLFWSHLSGNSRRVLTESSDTWINLNNNFQSLGKGEQFIWGSERNGFNHLYVMDPDGNVITTLTSGDWPVADVKGLGEDSFVYFEGYRDGPLERHLYRVSLDNPGVVSRITEPGYNHQVELSKDKKYFIDRNSSAMEPASVFLRKITGETQALLESNTLDNTHPFYPYSKSRGEVEFGELKAEDGQTLHYRLIKPTGISDNEVYPVLITVYGGPGVQRVVNEWIPPWHHYMAQRGYGLFQLDNRGSTNRGKSFEAPIYRQLGEIEVRDQLVGLEFLQDQSWVDAERIGVFGHSYGGYMTLMMMMKSQRLKAGISVAPVTDWALYDTHYTERYLSLPDENTEGYENSNVFRYASDLKGKLLLIHGMADDNVLFSNSTKLYKVLQELNIDFEMMNYPGAKHGLTGKKTNIHRYSTMDRFLDSYLRGD